MTDELSPPLRTLTRPELGVLDGIDGAAAHDLATPGAGAKRHREGERLLAFAEFARSLALARDTVDVADAVSEHLARSLDATFANLGLIDPETHMLRIEHRGALDVEIAERYRELPLQAATPLTDAMRSGAMVIVADRVAIIERYPNLMADSDRAGIEATASIPLLEDGVVCGVLGVGWAHPISGDDTLTGRLEAVAELTAGTVARTRATDLQTALITELQHHLLPELPYRRGLSIAVRYRAATAGSGFGGDWYDVIALDDDRTVLIAGDIVGHGIEAAAQMAVVRTAINAVVRLGTPVEDVVAAAQPAINSGPDAMIGTAVLCLIDRGRDCLHYASAGHPPMVMCAPDGTTSLLDTASGPVLGVSRRKAHAAEVPFLPGSTVVAYTDGLIERRGESLDKGIARVRKSLSEARRRADGVESTADAIMATAEDSDALTDDIALTVLHRTQTGPGPGSHPV